MTVIDSAYETMHLVPQGWAYLPIWSWAEMRHVVRLCIVSDIRFGGPVSPANPDAALDEHIPDLSFKAYSRLSGDATNKERVFDLLLDGPLPMAAIALRLDISYEAAKHAVYDMGGKVRACGKDEHNKTLYGVVPGETEASTRWLNPDSTRARIIALLAAEGPMSATHLAERLEMPRAAVGKCLRGNPGAFRKARLLRGYRLYELVEVNK